jgi:hypothetical protein
MHTNKVIFREATLSPFVGMRLMGQRKAKTLRVFEFIMNASLELRRQRTPQAEPFTLKCLLNQAKQALEIIQSDISSKRDTCLPSENQ